MIELDNVSRNYGRKVAVDRLTMRIAPGEIFAFLGPNGAGKTTTIKMMVGLLRPTSGSVRVGGHDMTTHAREAASLLGYVSDEPCLYDKLSGREFLEFVARIRGFDPGETARRIARQTEDFQLGDFLDALIETYSHGMQQRLTFAGALLHDPAVLVVDEPTVGLDPRSVRLLKDLLRRHAAAGATVFLSTHTLAVAEEIAERIGIVHRGRLRFLATRDEVADQLRSQQLSLEGMFLRITETVENGHGEPVGEDVPRD
ncbi:MAG: ABC transporter ATP-binding protein [Pirellulales bacterium]|nr:ABC transporter ATP-binding protein [Pirellulales bacterium]